MDDVGSATCMPRLTSIGQIQRHVALEKAPKHRSADGQGMHSESSNIGGSEKTEYHESMQVSHLVRCCPDLLDGEAVYCGSGGILLCIMVHPKIVSRTCGSLVWASEHLVFLAHVAAVSEPRDDDELH